MYFWNINELKRKLISGEISEDGAFIYFFAVLVLDTLWIATWGLFPTEYEPNVWDYAEMVGYVLIVIGGTFILYRRNGGSKGEKFFLRYFTLLWVLGIRFFVYCIPLVIFWAALIWQNENYPEPKLWYETMALLFTFVLYYWRLAVHIGEVVRASRI